MLPRNIHRKTSKNSNNDEDSYKEFRENINSNIEPNFNKKAHGYEHHQLPMKKLSVNNIINHNGSNVHRPSSHLEHRRHSPVPQHGNSVQNHNNNNNYLQNNNHCMSENNRPGQKSPNRYPKPQQNNSFLVQQSEPIA